MINEEELYELVGRLVVQGVAKDKLIAALQAQTRRPPVEDPKPPAAKKTTRKKTTATKDK